MNSLNKKKQTLTITVSILISVFLVLTTYAITTIGNDISVGGSLNVTATTTLSGLTVSGTISLPNNSIADAYIASASNWNTAYDYSQVGHLPLSGGTLTGHVIVEHSSAGFWVADSSNWNRYIAITVGPDVNGYPWIYGSPTLTLEDDTYSLTLENLNTAYDVSQDSTKVGWVSAPVSATSTCAAGQKAYDSNYLYICTATNTWERAGIASW